MSFRILIPLLVIGLFASEVRAQTAPARSLSPLDCTIRGKEKGKNIVACGGLRFQVSQKGHDVYNQFNILKDTKVSGVTVGSFMFRSLPTFDALDNGAYSKKLHFDLYDYGNLNGNKNAELIKAGDNVYLTFLVRFMTPAPTPIRGSKFDNDNIKYRRNLFFQFWPGGVATHFNSYPGDSDEAKEGKFGYVTVLTGDYGTNKPTLSTKFEVQKATWYRMYFQYNPDVSNGRIMAKIAAHEPELTTEKMSTIIDLKGNTLYETKANRRILPTIGNYHWGGSPNMVETQFTEVEISRSPIPKHELGSE